MTEFRGYPESGTHKHPVSSLPLFRGTGGEHLSPFVSLRVVASFP